MDTREKIVGSGELRKLLAVGNWTVVVGLFDPLTLVQAERIEREVRTGRRILAIVSPDPSALMTAEARAALIAALRSVDAVSMALASEWKPLLANLPGIEVVEDTAAERERSSEFVNFVLRRQRAGAIPIETAER